MADAPRRALLSVSDKRFVVEFARRLHQAGFRLLSTGGTGQALANAGIEFEPVEHLTGWGEMLGGRVKTLHPRVHGGILARRDRPEDLRELHAAEIPPIDLVAVNLYPFEHAVRRGLDEPAVLEHIDIGGPTLVRAAAKNWPWVTVVVDPCDYDRVAEAIEAHGEVPAALRRELASKAFAHTARYDAAIAAWFARSEPEGEHAGDTAVPPVLVEILERARVLRYGENPHQSAALYTRHGEPASGIAGVVQHQGKALSYNNLHDVDAALGLAALLPSPAAVVVKHANPCGVGVDAAGVDAALARALDADPISAFGGIVALNAPVDEPAARRLTSLFLEVVVAPGYTPAALEVLAAKRNLRVLEIRQPLREATARPYVLRDVAGGVLVQQPDTSDERVRQGRVVTRRAPTDEEYEALELAWRVCRFVRSNAIVVATPHAAVGIGAGQMSRVDAARLAVQRARVDLRGTAAASDAFFPFRDGLDVLADAGVTAVVQPGGSIRDAEVVAAADERGMAMVLTGVRHFRH